MIGPHAAGLLRAGLAAPCPVICPHSRVQFNENLFSLLKPLYGLLVAGLTSFFTALPLQQRCPGHLSALLKTILTPYLPIPLKTQESDPVDPELPLYYPFIPSTAPKTRLPLKTPAKSVAWEAQNASRLSLFFSSSGSSWYSMRLTVTMSPDCPHETHIDRM